VTQREKLAQYLETQAYHCKAIADKLRNCEDVSSDYWKIDVFNTVEWNAEMAAIEAQEQLQYEHNRAIEMEAKTA
jgi:hypothetical protein